MILRLILLSFFLTLTTLSRSSEIYIPTREEISQGDVEIISGDDRTVYEYRVNGYLLMIKVVPNEGRTYYMVPANGKPHYESLDHGQKLYPQWVLVEW